MSDKSKTDTAIEVDKTNGGVDTLRDKLRDQIFSGVAEKIRMSFKGADIEVHQPTLGQILEAQAAGPQERGELVIQLIINQVFIPNTSIKVFEESDAPTLRELGFDKDMVELNRVLTKMTTLAFGDEEKNLSETLSST